MYLKPLRLLVQAALFMLTLSASANAITLTKNNAVAVVLTQGQDFEGVRFAAYLLAIGGDVVIAGKSAVHEIALTATPLPPALLLFGSGLAGLTLLGRRTKRRDHV